MRHKTTRRLPSAHLIQTLELKALAHRPLSVRVADFLVSYFGTAWFFFICFVVTVIWIALNLGWVAGIIPFDPYPFILLTMVASVGAIFMTVIVLMSQNRQAHINTLRSELLLQMILITERELTRALRLLVGRARSNSEQKRFDRELVEMLKDTNVSGIERKLEELLHTNRKS